MHFFHFRDRSYFHAFIKIKTNKNIVDVVKDFSSYIKDWKLFHWFINTEPLWNSSTETEHKGFIMFLSKWGCGKERGLAVEMNGREE